MACTLGKHPCVRFVVEDMHRTVSHLQKIDMASDCSTRARGKVNAVLCIEHGYGTFVEPYRHFDGDRR